MHKKKPDTYFNETCIRFSYHFRIKSERNHSIFRHDNFIGCFSADKIKMSARK